MTKIEKYFRETDQITGAWFYGSDMDYRDTL